VTPTVEVCTIVNRLASIVVYLALVLLVAGAMSVPAFAQGETQRGDTPTRYIVIFDDGPDAAVTISDVASTLDTEVTHVYSHAVKGFAAAIPEDKLESLRRNPRVRLIEPDITVQAADQTLPTGVDRIDTEWNVTADIDGVDERVDIDIAIIDTGIDIDHPDLNVVGGVRYYTSGSQTYEDNEYDDDHGHGTHVAGTAGAIDNSIGVVGVAPGARLWAVKVLDSSGDGNLADVIAGVDWVTAHADTIEIANLSMQGQGTSAALRQAIQNGVAAGILFTAAAGNNHQNVYGSDGIFGTDDDFLPAAYPEVAAISALADADGQPGGLGGSTSNGPDDSFASLSNYSTSVVTGNPVTSPGAAIDMLMPGIGIFSTELNGTYGLRNGTSMASAHAAGLAALYIASAGTRDFNGDTFIDENDVYAIRQAMIDDGVAQTDPEGLATLNDPDSNPERIGFAERDLPTETITTPDAPSGPTAASVGQIVTFTTGGASSNLGHTVQYRFDWDDGSYSTWSLSTSASHSWSSEGNYTVRAQARCSIHTSVVSEWSDGTEIAVAFIVSDSPPAAPSDLTATGASGPRIDLSWQDNSNNELGFSIWRKNREPGIYHELAAVGTDVTTYSDTDVVPGQECSYKVKAWNYIQGPLGPEETFSDYSNVASATTPSSGGCFIASAAYGSYLDAHVETLRGYRDGYMADDSIGRSFVFVYYAVSPRIADFIDEHPALKPGIRAALLPAVGVSTAANGVCLGCKVAITAMLLLVTAIGPFVARRRIVSVRA
jgi:subtilisin family serine protease